MITIEFIEPNITREEHNKQVEKVADVLRSILADFTEEEILEIHNNDSKITRKLNNNDLIIKGLD